MTPTSLVGYADCFAGISGDMFLGALLHCGVSRDFLQSELAKLDIGGVDLEVTTRTVHGIGSFKVDVISHQQQNLRHLSTIVTILEQAQLSDSVTAKSIEVFKEIARAEAKVHNTGIEQVHFHEVGAVDTIVDVVGTITGLDHLGIQKLVASPLPMPRGFVECDHGTLPLPAPAVCEILQGVPCYGVDLDRELVTPTGAALIKTLASDFGPMPPMTIRTTGYGAGSTTLPNNHPNLLRFFVGEAHTVMEHQQVEVIETHLDDCNPEGFPHLYDLLLAGGALDVSLTPLQMKKGRPGFKLQIISAPAHTAALKKIVFRETSAIGIRFHRVQRQTLPRQAVTVVTPWGAITAKMVTTPDGDTIYPEYEECRKVAVEHGVALQKVYEAVIRGEHEQ